MQAVWSLLMSMPDSQEGQHARRERAMHGQMGPHDAMPILHGEAFSHRALPGAQQGLSFFSPGRIKALQQVLGAWPQQGAPRPAPGQQMHGVRPQALTGLLLGFIKVSGKQQQMGKCQTQLRSPRLELLLQGGQRLFSQFLQQRKPRFQFLLTISVASHSCLPLRTQDHDVQQGMQFLREIAQSLCDVLGSCDAGARVQRWWFGETVHALSCLGPPALPAVG
jgi:hypothetical protein